MTDTDKPRFTLELSLARLEGHVEVDATLIPDELLDQAWNVVSDLVMDIFDKLGEEPTDEEFRARFIEVCYRLAFREMFTLRYMPMWEKADLERLGTRERGVRLKKKGSYDDGDW